MSNQDVTKCPDTCFRPVGLAFDSKGRLFMTSDSTGEIYIITATNGAGVDSMAVTVNGASSNSAGSGSGAKKGEGANSGVNLALMIGMFALLALFETSQ
jgi:hypothetical protein